MGTSSSGELCWQINAVIHTVSSETSSSPVSVLAEVATSRPALKINDKHKSLRKVKAAGFLEGDFYIRI